MRVAARDQGSPQQSSEAVVTVRVVRNRFSPVFPTRRYTATIAATFTPSLPLVTVQALDADPPGPNSDVTYAVVGDQVALDLFSVDASSGVVTLRQSVVDRSDNQYMVSVNNKLRQRAVWHR